VVLQLPRGEFPEDDDLSLSVLRCRDTVEILTDDVTAVLRRLLAAGISLSRLQIRERTLDDLFLELTGKELRA